MCLPKVGLRYIREKGITAPVIIITAYPSIKNAVECTKMGVVAYLQKPFTAEKVRNILSGIQGSTIHQEGKYREQDYCEKALRLMTEGDYLEAFAYLKKILAQNSLDPNIYLMLSKASNGLNFTEEAEKYMKIHKSIIGE